MIIKDLLEKLQNPENIKKWKENAKLELTKLAKSSNPFKQLKVSPYYFYVEKTETRMRSSFCRRKTYTENFSFLRIKKKIRPRI